MTCNPETGYASLAVYLDTGSSARRKKATAALLASPVLSPMISQVGMYLWELLPSVESITVEFGQYHKHFQYLPTLLHLFSTLR
jgi:hypothetical protein